MSHHETHFIGGAWVPSTGTEVIDVVNPSTEQVIGTIPAGTAEDVDRAVRAARAAFDGWSTTPVESRRDLLLAAAKELEARSEELGRLISSEMGSPLSMAVSVQAGMPAASFATAAEVLATYEFETAVGESTVVREPIGVVGAIAPWNYPLHQICAKVAPALAAGCTVVVKPSEVAPLNAFVLAEILESVGLPPGVFNLVNGSGPVVGEAIAAHPEVDMVSFTGSTGAGRRVAALASETVKRVTLELGGKSPNIILDDADLEQAITAGVAACYPNSGQTCSALTRMLVPRARLAEVEEIATRAAESYVTGDPLDEATQLGPLVSSVQRDRVRAYIGRGIEEGARLVTGGAEPPTGIEQGYYVRPTIFSDVSPDMTIAREEIFGPVLSILPYDDEDEAVRIANDTIYGLGGGVWSGSEERARAVAKRIRTGQVAINGGRFNMWAPFGGYKQSGLGREFGTYGFEEYLEVKALL